MIGLWSFVYNNSDTLGDWFVIICSHASPGRIMQSQRCSERYVNSTPSSISWESFFTDFIQGTVRNTRASDVSHSFVTNTLALSLNFTNLLIYTSTIYFVGFRLKKCTYPLTSKPFVLLFQNLAFHNTRIYCLILNADRDWKASSNQYFITTYCEYEKVTSLHVVM